MYVSSTGHSLPSLGCRHKTSEPSVGLAEGSWHRFRLLLLLQLFRCFALKLFNNYLLYNKPMLEKIKTKIVSLCYWLCFRLCIVTIRVHVSRSVNRNKATDDRAPTSGWLWLLFVCLFVGLFCFFMDIDYVFCCFTIYYLFASVAYSFPFSLFSS